MELTIGQHFHWTNMRKTIQLHCSKCILCQKSKKNQQKFGKLPEKQAQCVPWCEVCIDLIGPYKFGNAKMNKEVRFHCLAMIDPATGWFEIVEISDKTAIEVAERFEQTWLNRYPWPDIVVMDRGKEFMGEVKTMLVEQLRHCSQTHNHTKPTS